MRQLKYHERKLLKKVDFLQWKKEHSLREVQVAHMHLSVSTYAGRFKNKFGLCCHCSATIGGCIFHFCLVTRRICHRNFSAGIPMHERFAPPDSLAAKSCSPIPDRFHLFNLIEQSLLKKLLLLQILLAPSFNTP